ncbi:hypothetical protein TrRE_jg11447 [Triparma retinervis]|uniref:Uncharacterized protein n=1 Tax=Triparma retinervis TaxID=2557542 RepID=A0A9W7G0R4_9STRA|nr:hypothetical protein TrRE_jg11447 [Triparma retinervis]
MSGSVRHFKLVLLGDTAVGKSCLVVRFVRDEFFEFQEPTIGAAFLTQSVQLDSSVVKFEIWDTAGQERYRSLAPMYYRGASAAIVVFDLSNKESYNGAKSWVKAYAEENNILYLETSAKNAANVKNLFVEIAKKLPQQAMQQEREQGFTISPPKQEKKSCC